MKSLQFSKDTSLYFSNILDKFKKNKSNGSSFGAWFLVWYFGTSILLLLSLHSYYMGFGK